MKRSINSTGRKRITGDMVTFTVHRSSSGVHGSFEADLHGLHNLGLPVTARVFVEAGIGTSSMRFDFGTVGHVRPPASCSLEALDQHAGGIVFRVMVVEEGTGLLGRLLAEGDRLADGDGGSGRGGRRRALMPVRLLPLGEKVWALSLTEARPYLDLNIRIPGIQNRITSDRCLAGAIIPEAVRHVVRAMLQSDAEVTPWFEDWRCFLVDTLKCADPTSIAEEGDDAVEEYIELAVSAFIELSKFASASIELPVTEVSSD